MTAKKKKDPPATNGNGESKLDKARKLLALAKGNENKEEALTAAYKAAELAIAIAEANAAQKTEGDIDPKEAAKQDTQRLVRGAVLGYVASELLRNFAR